MANEKMIPLEYCTPARAARLLGCELEDIFHWYEIGAIKLFLKLDKDCEWPSGGSGFVCNNVYFDNVMLGELCHQGEYGTTDVEYMGIGNGTLHSYGTNVIFHISDELNSEDLDSEKINECDEFVAETDDDETEQTLEEQHGLWVKLERYDLPVIEESDTPSEKKAKYESLKRLAYISYKVWTSGFHEVSIPYTYLRAGFMKGFENIEMIGTVSLKIDICDKSIYIDGAHIEDCASLFRVCSDDLLRMKDSIASGNALNKYVRDTPPSHENIYSDIDAPVRVTDKQSKAIVDLLTSLGYTPADLKGSTEALQQKITRNGHSKQLSSLTAKTLRTWLGRGEGR
ncbi:hypothetical protein L1S45_00570 [Aeromonas dhakensis]|uniref:hypothetical protein n=1 Tax=Aeromonas dhakensis TaxID=196024 RepID=UPI00208E240C|nr:hypothetical protein [Aeromonas dhakensis]USP10159.1 hypothetical protein L1S45_00570 [Aeromonas dhakensis]